MPSESRLLQRDKILRELHFLVDPLRRLWTDPDWKSKFPFVESVFRKEKSEVHASLRNYSIAIGIEHSQIAQIAEDAVYRLPDILPFQTSDNRLTDGKNVLMQLLDRASDAIRALPCDDVSAIMPGSSPFATYRRILALCNSARTRVDVIDPYLDKDVFDRYFADIE